VNHIPRTLFQISDTDTTRHNADAEIVVDIYGDVASDWC